MSNTEINGTTSKPAPVSDHRAALMRSLYRREFVQIEWRARTGESCAAFGVVGTVTAEHAIVFATRQTGGSIVPIERIQTITPIELPRRRGVW